MTDDIALTLEERCPQCDGLGWACSHCLDGRRRRTITVPRAIVPDDYHHD